MVKATARGLVNWPQFVSMFPPEKPFHALLVRDYLLVYLYSALRDNLEEYLNLSCPKHATSLLSK
jgi:hypothetical protein